MSHVQAHKYFLTKHSECNKLNNFTSVQNRFCCQMSYLNILFLRPF